MAKILVTGGAGFIGSHLVDALIEQNHQVLVIDNLVSGNKANLNEQATFLEKDITDNLSELFLENNFDYVFHLAAQINVCKSVENPFFDANINITGSLNLIQESYKHQVKKFVFISTGGAMYGEANAIPTSETADCQPDSPYGEAKYTIERYLELYNKLHDLDYMIYRFANVYGPRQSSLGEAGVISIFSNKLLKDQATVVYGDGYQTRDYIYITDVINALVLAITSQKKAVVYNVGTGIETSVNSLLAIISEKIGKEFKPDYLPARDGEVLQSCLNYAKIKEDLGWEPKVSLTDGLSQAIAYYQ